MFDRSKLELLRDVTVTRIGDALSYGFPQTEQLGLAFFNTFTLKVYSKALIKETTFKKLNPKKNLNRGEHGARNTLFWVMISFDTDHTCLKSFGNGIANGLASDLKCC